MASVERRKNFASQAHGAKTLQQLTSVGIAKSWILSKFQSTTSKSTMLSLASLALNDRIDLANCWEFTGSRAKLAIRLSEYVVITQISLEQPIDNLSYIQSSPRSVVVWGMVDGRENIVRVSNRSRLRGLYARLNPPMAAPFLQGYSFLPLVAFRYDASISGRQYVDVFDEILELGVDFGIVVIEIHGNWGSSDTRLCHVGVYGFQTKEPL